VKKSAGYTGCRRGVEMAPRQGHALASVINQLRPIKIS